MNLVPRYAAHHRAWDDCWQSLLAHLLGVAKLSKLYATKGKLGELGELVGLLHDLGKYSQSLQT